MAAQAVVLKGDLDPAQRLLIQADVDDPWCTDPRERFQWVERQKGRFEVSAPTLSPKGRSSIYSLRPHCAGSQPGPAHSFRSIQISLPAPRASSIARYDVLKHIPAL